MAAAEHKASKKLNEQADSSLLPPYSCRAKELADEIDRLRKAMTEKFLQERSLVADSVMELSRQLDRKIIEYMKVSLPRRD